MQTLLDCIIYFSCLSFTIYGTAYALPLGLTLFSAGALLAAFCLAAFSLFRMLTRCHE